jgi:hypothetical protein
MPTKKVHSKKVAPVKKAVKRLAKKKACKACCEPTPVVKHKKGLVDLLVVFATSGVVIAFAFFLVQFIF